MGGCDSPLNVGRCSQGAQKISGKTKDPEPAFAGDGSSLLRRSLPPAKAGSTFSNLPVPRVSLASLTSPWAKLFRLLRRLVP